MIISSATPIDGGWDVTDVDGVKYFVPDDPKNSDREVVQAFLDAVAMPDGSGVAGAAGGVGT